MAKRVLLAAPRGYCAGVDRAVITVEKALALYGAPVYVRKQIVHNVHVVASLEAKGAIFVEETDEVPEGKTVVFSAHGVAPVVHEQAAARSLKTIDATCPLVTKVHMEARRFAAEDAEILLIGHHGHEEVEGTAGEAVGQVRIVDGLDGARNVQPTPGKKLVWLSQTTLSVDETLDAVAILKMFSRWQFRHRRCAFDEQQQIQQPRQRVGPARLLTEKRASRGIQLTAIMLVPEPERMWILVIFRKEQERAAHEMVTHSLNIIAEREK